MSNRHNQIYTGSSNLLFSVLQINLTGCLPFIFYLLHILFPVSMLKTDFYVCGLAPLGDDLVVLAFVTEGPIQDVRTNLSKKYTNALYWLNT